MSIRKETRRNNVVRYTIVVILGLVVTIAIIFAIMWLTGWRGN